MKKSYKNRSYIIISTIVLVGLIFIGRLFYLQIIDKSYILSATNNVIRRITQYPARGLIYDRNGKILVHNEAAFDLMVVPRDVNDIDTTEFCNLIGIDKKNYEERLKKAKNYSYHRPSIFLKQLSMEEYAFLEEKLYKFPGFFVQSRTLRKYPSPIAAHTLGYVGEVSKNVLKRDDYYRQGDYIGISGLEKTYEKELRGKKGLKVIKVDVFNRNMGSFKNGKYDKPAHMGENLYTGLDAELQAYGEKLMRKKKGSIVAIEPSSGEILAFVTSPGYDPNLLVGRERTKNFIKLNKDTINPLLNRAIMGQYPPGSTFKLVTDLIGLHENAISKHTMFKCQGKESWPIKCTHYHVTPLDLIEAIQQSCNPYHWKVFRNFINKPTFGNPEEAYKTYRKHVTSLGFGHKFDTDLTYELNGNVPPPDYYSDIYGKGHWNALTIRSLAIGQGEILVTPLQLANFAATIANRGVYYTPHLVSQIGEGENTDIIKPEMHRSTLDSADFEPIIEGMHQVFVGEHGTARWYNIDSIPMAGKTGTVENPHGDDHSLFISYAPKNNAKIALSVVVENAGYGSKWAVPISTLMIEKYLNREINRNWLEKRMLEGNLLDPSKKDKEEEE
ncbi:MAG: penicillin-binding protein 2 [Bacteroidales bacterium]|nr:penicillin-binding protein 2 [Bacteroidales bacterium]